MNGTTSILADRYHEAPFPHGHLNGVFSEDLALLLGEWLRSGSHEWKFVDEPNIRVRTFYWDSEGAPDPVADHLTIDLMQDIRRRCEALVGCRLEPVFRVSGNVQLPGDGSLVHTDFFGARTDHPFFFTHRLIVYLSPDWQPAHGGVLGLFEAIDGKPAEILNAQFNTGVFLKMTENSFHAVSAIRAGSRYTMVFSFVEVGAR